MSEIRDGENLWQWSQLEIRLDAFCQSTILFSDKFHQPLLLRSQTNFSNQLLLIDAMKVTQTISFSKYQTDLSWQPVWLEKLGSYTPAKCGNSFLVRFISSCYNAPTSTLLPPFFSRENFPTNSKNVFKSSQIFNLNGIKNRIRTLNYDRLPILVSMYKYRHNSSPIRDPLGCMTQLNVLDFTSCYQGSA